MRNIEDTVRDAMRHTVRQPPAMRDSLGRALVGARRVRRRRVLVAAAATAFALIATIGGTAVLRGGAQRPPVDPGNTVSPSMTGSTLPVAGVAVLVGDQAILTADGRSISLTGISAGADQPYETPSGWLLDSDGTQPDTRSLWLVRPDGSPWRLVDNAERSVAVSADGTRFAWRSGGQLRVGHLAGTRVAPDYSTTAPERGAPLSFAGDTVLLAYSQTGGGLDAFDVWNPAAGAYVSRLDRTTHVVTVFPDASGDTSFLGLVQRSPGSKETCLARLDPADDLRATATACGLWTLPVDAGRVSPDGRYLVVEVPDNEPRFQAVDLDHVFQRPTIDATWAAYGPGVWSSATTFVALTSDRDFVRFHIGQDEPEPVRVPGMSGGGPFELIPRSR